MAPPILHRCIVTYSVLFEAEDWCYEHATTGTWDVKWLSYDTEDGSDDYYFEFSDKDEFMLFSLRFG